MKFKKLIVVTAADALLLNISLSTARNELNRVE